MNTVYHKADSRGFANHGWLKSYHSFSFAGYHNPERIHFGALRVLNDDEVAGGAGFGKHPHDNMEIISIPLEGDLEHGDDMGNRTVIKQGDVQLMSAGTGVVHSEKNGQTNAPVKFLQIWVFPEKRDIQPRYDQKTFAPADFQNKLATVVSPLGQGEGVEINQQAWFSKGHFDQSTTINYRWHRKENGLYIFVLEGSVTAGTQVLQRRDGLGIWNTNEIVLKPEAGTQLLLMEIPMN